MTDEPMCDPPNSFPVHRQERHFYARDSAVCRCGVRRRERDPVAGWKSRAPVEVKLQIAPGTLTALAGRHDNRAYYTFSGDLSQMGTIETFLRARGFAVVKSDVYPGFPQRELAEYVRALRLLYEERIDGWWNQEAALVEYGICTLQEFRARLEDAP